MKVRDGRVRARYWAISVTLVLLIGAMCQAAEKNDSWSLSLAQTSFQLNSDTTNPIFLFLNSPKATTVEMILRFEFLNPQGKVVLLGATGFSVPPGKSLQMLFIDAILVQFVKEEGCAKVELKLENRQSRRVAHLDLAVDYDLQATVTASPIAGPGPLEVHFSCLPSGGTPPYTYLWHFGAGDGESSDPAPTHVFIQSYVHDVTCVVTDSANGTFIGKLAIDVQ